MTLMFLQSYPPVTSQQMKYHKRCLKTFDNKYNAVVNSELKQENSSSFDFEFQKELNFRKIVSYIIEQR